MSQGMGRVAPYLDASPVGGSGSETVSRGRRREAPAGARKTTESLSRRPVAEDEMQPRGRVVTTDVKCRCVLSGGMRARTTTTNLCPSGATMRISSFGRASAGTLTTIRVEFSGTMGTCGGMCPIGGMPGIVGGAIIIEAPGAHTPIGGALDPAAVLK